MMEDIQLTYTRRKCLLEHLTGLYIHKPFCQIFSLKETTKAGLHQEFLSVLEGGHSWHEIWFLQRTTILPSHNHSHHGSYNEMTLENERAGIFPQLSSPLERACMLSLYSFTTCWFWYIWKDRVLQKKYVKNAKKATLLENVGDLPSLFEKDLVSAQLSTLAWHEYKLCFLAYPPSPSLLLNNIHVPCLVRKNMVDGASS